MGCRRGRQGGCCFSASRGRGRCALGQMGYLRRRGTSKFARDHTEKPDVAAPAEFACLILAGTSAAGGAASTRPLPACRYPFRGPRARTRVNDAPPRPREEPGTTAARPVVGRRVVRRSPASRSRAPFIALATEGYTVERGTSSGLGMYVRALLPAVAGGARRRGPARTVRPHGRSPTTARAIPPAASRWPARGRLFASDMNGYNDAGARSATGTRVSTRRRTALWGIGTCRCRRSNSLRG